MTYIAATATTENEIILSVIVTLPRFPEGADTSVRPYPEPVATRVFSSLGLFRRGGPMCPPLRTVSIMPREHDEECRRSLTDRHARRSGWGRNASSPSRAPP